MPTSRTNPPPPLKRGFKADAEKKALFFRRELMLKEYDPLSASKLAEYLSISILIPNEISGITQDILDRLLIDGKNYWSAAIFLKDEKRFIIHNPTHVPCRQESNIMHEIAHAVCNHELSNLESNLNGSIIPLRKYDIVQEAEAEWLGSCLQLPQRALVHHFHFKKKNPAQIAELFNASEQMVNYRLSITGVRKMKFR